MLVSTEWLHGNLDNPALAVVDVRNVTGDPGGGVRMYREAHIPGAVFMDMNTDLADRSDLSRGRHPLPDPEHFVAALARAGIGRGRRVIAYDDSAGSNAARLWWMMRWIGVHDAAVLDGGIRKWMHEGRPLESRFVHAPQADAPLAARADSGMAVERDTVARAPELGLLIIDARSPERYRGESEPIDTRAGCIPHSVNVPWQQNLTPSDVPVMKTPAELRRMYTAAGVTDPAAAVCYCGSGVTACFDILAMELAGLRGARLYPGSWSEWIATD